MLSAPCTGIFTESPSGPILSRPARRERMGVKTNQATPPHRLLTRAEVAEHLATTERHVRRLTEDGRMRSVRLGGKVRIHSSHLDEFLDQLRAASSTEPGDRSAVNSPTGETIAPPREARVPQLMGI
jgi:excisionase family DNA binding protein